MKFRVIHIIVVILIVLLIILGKNVFAQTLNAVQADFLKTNAQVICKDEAMAEAAWKLNANELKGKRIVVLGESNHGSREIFLLRNSLIKHLHEKMGFNTILFESGIGELAFYEQEKVNSSAGQMANGLFGGWRTKEFRELMEYIKSANISIAGFDVQRSGGSFRYLLQQAAAKKNIDSLLYYDLEERYGVMQRELTNRKAVYDSVKLKTSQLISDYLKMKKLLQQDNASASTKEILFALQAISNRVKFLEYMLDFVKDGNTEKKWAARDSMMAENILWLCENIYQDEKIIIVAHNYHAAKFNETEKVMGNFLNKHFGPALYGIGFFTGTGVYANNSGIEQAAAPADATGLDIKTVIKESNGFAALLPIPEKNKKGAEWLFENIIVKDSFTDTKNSNRLILAKQFDAIVLIQKTSMPVK